MYYEAVEFRWDKENVVPNHSRIRYSAIQATSEHISIALPNIMVIVHIH